MPFGTQAAVGGKVAAGITNQFSDMPSGVSVNSDTTTRLISSASFANIPTASIATSLVLTRTTLVAVNISVAIGSGGLATPTGIAALGYNLSGALTEAATDLKAVTGFTPGTQIISPAATFWYVVPAGTLTATLQARIVLGGNVNIRNHMVQLVAVRAA